MRCHGWKCSPLPRGSTRVTSEWVLKVIPWVGPNGTIMRTSSADGSCSLFSDADTHDTAVCAMPQVPEKCFLHPARCSRKYPPVQVAPIALAGKPDPWLWGRVQHHGDWTAAVGGPFANRACRIRVC